MGARRGRAGRDRLPHRGDGGGAHGARPHRPAVEAGARLELTNDTGRTIEAPGYDGEPYLATSTGPEVWPVLTGLGALAAGAHGTGTTARPPTSPSPLPAPAWPFSPIKDFSAWFDLCSDNKSLIDEKV